MRAPWRPAAWAQLSSGTTLTAVDARHHLTVAHEVTNAATDRGQLAAMARAAKEAAAHPSPIVLADRGYFAGHQILECERAGIATMVPKPLTSGGKFDGRCVTSSTTVSADVYRCPAGEIAVAIPERFFLFAAPKRRGPGSTLGLRVRTPSRSFGKCFKSFLRV